MLGSCTCRLPLFGAGKSLEKVKILVRSSAVGLRMRSLCRGRTAAREWESKLGKRRSCNRIMVSVVLVPGMSDVS